MDHELTGWRTVVAVYSTRMTWNRPETHGSAETPRYLIMLPFNVIRIHRSAIGFVI